MDEQKEQSGENNSMTFGDETLRQYLLCVLSEELRSKIEEELLISDELEERLRLAEFELADDYAFKRLSEKERENFENKFLVTNERRQKLKASQALHNFTALQKNSEQKASATDVETTRSLSERISNLFSFKRPAFKFAVSFAVLVLLIGAVWFVTRDSRKKDDPIIVRTENPTPTPHPSPQITTSPTPQTTISPQPSPKTIPTPQDSTTISIASFVLLPGSLRDGGDMTRITLPKGERDIVRLQLTLESSETGTYRAQLLTAEGQSVYTANKLKANKSNTQIIFDVSARLLRAGDYQIKLGKVTTDGETESIGRYYFRALER